MKGNAKVRERVCGPRLKPLAKYITKRFAPMSACCLALAIGAYPSVILAGPEGGVITGGVGAINHAGATTTIQQTTQNMAIDWQSYNVRADERVQYLQPNASSISLNRILSNQGSTIAGRIDANGRVILVNPNGVLFTPTSVLNVGSLIASGLDIQSSDFMNGHYIFNEVLGTDGGVINSGLINASLGGNVALVGRHVENNGVIAANLGAVTLAAGKEAVLTFDDAGLLGIRVTKEVLQSELGVDPAVVNSGEIQAQGGRVLLTASTSQDIFSRSVNTAGLEQATSVVVHEDGSFTLGGGADVVNSGAIDTSTSHAGHTIGRIVLLGDNVTSRGELRADAAQGNAGEIELHAQGTALLTQNSVTSVRAEATGEGGIVKVLGERVGVLDTATVDVSGAQGGGQALIGGDFQGSNPLIRNAGRTTIAPEAAIHADALDHGDGGQVIVWADEYSRYYGNLTARGGVDGGHGGFAEVSGKEAMVFEGDADLSAPAGDAGMLLLDPKNITISASPTTGGNFPGDFDAFGAIAAESTVLNNSALADRLRTNEVTLRANNDITFVADVTSAQTTSGVDLLDNNLTLQAGRSIIINDNVKIALTDANFIATVNHVGALSANRETGAAVFQMGPQSSIVTNKRSTSTTNSGHITIASGSFAGAVGDFTLTTLDSSVNGEETSAIASGGNITVTNSGGNILLNGAVSTGGEGWGAVTANQTGGNGGNVTLAATNGNITINSSGSINTNGGNAGGTNRSGGSAGPISLYATTVNLYGPITANGGNATDIDNAAGAGGNVSVAVSGDLTLEANFTSSRGTVGNTATDGWITFNGSGAANIFKINNNITLTGLTVTIDGKGGNDQLVRGGAGSTDNTWTLFNFGTGADGVNDGTLEFGSNAGTKAIRFVDIANLVGGSGKDDFIINGGGSITGLIDGAAGTDSLTINAAGNQTVELGNRITANINVYRVETITGNAATINTLFGDNTSNTWNITGDNIGTVNDGAATTNFYNFAFLTGGTGSDEFTIDTTGSISMAINGGTGTGVNTLKGRDDGSKANNWNIADLNFGTISSESTIYATFSNIQNLNGGTGVDNFSFTTGTSAIAGTVDGGVGVNTLTGRNAGNTWDVTAENTGTVSTSVQYASFKNIQNFTGGTGVDTFELAANVTGTIRGGDGNDIFNVNAIGLTINPMLGGNGIDTVRGPDAGNNWVVTGAGTGTLNTTIAFQQMETLIGGTGTGVDTFTVNASTSIGTINGAGGADVITVDGTVTSINGGNDSDTITINNSGGVTTLDAAGGNNTIVVKTGGNVGAISSGTGDDTLSVAGTAASIDTGAGVNTVTVETSGSVTGAISGGAGADSITVNGAAGSVVAGDANDNITLGATGTVSGALSGGAGVDTIAVSGSAGSIAAGDGDDTITLIATGTVSGLIDGGAGSDTLDLKALTSPTTVQLGNTLTANLDVFQIETIGANNAVTNTLIGDNGNNTWAIIAANEGTVASIGFKGFRNLTGGTGNDTFQLPNAGDITGLIDGGAGTDRLEIANGNNVWKITDIVNNTGSVAAGTSTTNFTHVEQRQGSASGTDAIDLSALNGTYNLGDYAGFDLIIGNMSSTLVGGNSGNTWSIAEVLGADNVTLTDGKNDGTVNATTRFIDFGNLKGGSGADIFTITSTGSFAGTLDGVGGINTLVAQDAVTNIWNIAAANSTLSYGAIPTTTTFNNVQNLTGGSGDDTFTVQTETTIASIDARNGNNTVTINAGGTVTGAITGGTGVDTIAVNGSAGSISAGDSNDAITLGAIGAVSGLIDGGAGSDTLNLAALTSATTVQLGNASTANLDAYQVERIDANTAMANTLIGDNGNNIWAITGATSTVAGIDFTGFSTLIGGSGNDTFTVQNGATLASLDAGNGTNAVTINAGGTVTGAITSGTGVDTIAVNGSAGSISAGDSNDAITLGAVGAVSGVIDGGAGSDTLNLTALTSPTTVQLGNASTANLDMYQVERIDANSAVANTLIGDNANNIWAITGATSTVAGIDFTGFSTLIGGSGNDTFTVQNAAMIANIDARNGNNTVTINAGGTVTGAITSGTGVDSITVNGSAGSISAGDSADAITLGATGVVSGLIDGGVGSDTLNLTALTSATTVQLGNTLTANLDVYQVERIDANSAVANTLIGDNGNNTWDVTGTNSGKVNSVDFYNFSHLVGRDQTDTFNLNEGGRLSGLISGAGGTNILNVNSATATTVRVVSTVPAAVDNPPNALTVYQMTDINGNSAHEHTLVGPDTRTIWNINTQNSGNMNYGPIVGFTGFRNLTGGAANDEFNLSSNNVPELVTGIISGGGQATQDSINLAGMTGIAKDVAIQLGNTADNAVGNAINVHGVERITGNNGGMLIADNTPNNWNISGENDGEINPGTAAQVAFSDFSSLRGGSNDDSFSVRFDGTLTATIDGGAQSVADTADYSGLATVSVNFGSVSFNGITGLEGVRGNGTHSTLNGPTPSAASDVVLWNVDGLNTGSVVYNGETLVFEGFNYLMGGDGVDTFVVSDGALKNITNGVPGLISGGGGINVLNINLSGTGVIDASLNYVGGADADAININDHSTAYYQASYAPVVAFADPSNPANTGPFEQLTYRFTDANRGIDNAFALNYRNAEAVHTAQRIETFMVFGADDNSAPETITLSNGAFSVDGRMTVNYSNVSNVAIDGRGGIDTVLLDNPTVAGVLTLTAENVSDTTGSTLIADTVVLDGVGQFGAADDAIETSIDRLALVNAGPVYINESADLNISTIGEVTNSGVFVIGGTTNIDAGGGSLTLNNAANDFDTVEVTNAEAITLHDVDNIAGGDMTADSITLHAASGVGSAAAKLQTHTTELTITDTNSVDDSAGVYVVNDQAVLLNITNAGDIDVTNTGNVTVDKLYAKRDEISGTSVTSIPAGNVRLETDRVGTITSGSSHGVGVAPDIIGENLFVKTSGGFGTPSRQMSILVPDTFTYFGPRGYVYYYGRRPDNVYGAANLVVLTGLTGLANQQMIEVESLADIDPAIFTEIRNYYYEDVAIMMPEDQRYDYDEEDEKERKKRAAVSVQ